jgi:hypothetical protein
MAAPDDLKKLGDLPKRAKEHFEVCIRRLQNYGFSREDAILMLEDLQYWFDAVASEKNEKN